MGKILLVDKNEHFLELGRLGLEERTGEEVIIAKTVKEVVGILKNGEAFDLVISHYQPELLAFLISTNSSTPFFFLTDEKRIEIPFTPTMFVGVFRRKQFVKMCDTVVSILRKNRH